MTDSATGVSGGLPLEDLQHWTWVVGRAQQMMLEFWDHAIARAVRMSHRRPPARSTPGPNRLA